MKTAYKLFVRGDFPVDARAHRLPRLRMHPPQGPELVPRYSASLLSTSLV
jgi:hypothetical protein